MSTASRIPVIGRLFRKRKSEARIYRGIQSVRRDARPLYYLIRAFFKLVIQTQHSEIRAIGLENIPPDGSVLLVGNHPNSYLDYFNLLHVIRHPVATAAKDTITSWFLLGPLLRNHMLMVPIARRQDQDETGASEEDRREANEKAVREAVELLVQGRLFNIFAEGRSTDSRKLNKIKMGFMHMAILAEKEYNFKLNLRIVPFGFFYDRINKFQNSVVIAFGKPMKLKDLVDLPEDFLSLPDGERSALEKRIMLAGKNRMQTDIEDLIISIRDKNLVDLIDDITALYVKSPFKYMGPFNNIAEKYRLSKIISDSIQIARDRPEGREKLETLKRQMSAYRKELKKSGLRDAVIRREHTWAELGYHLRVLIKGVLFAPFILYGHLANFLPRMMGRFMRYYVIEVKKRAKVDGDEQAIIGAVVTGLITYPILGVGIFVLLRDYVLGPAFELIHNLIGPSPIVDVLAGHPVATAGGLAVLSVYLMARLWRFSLYHGQQLKDAYYWSKDSLVEILRGRDVRRLREMRYDIIDTMDFVIGDCY